MKQETKREAFEKIKQDIDNLVKEYFSKNPNMKKFLDDFNKVDIEKQLSGYAILYTLNEIVKSLEYRHRKMSSVYEFLQDVRNGKSDMDFIFPNNQVQMTVEILDNTICDLNKILSTIKWWRN